MPTNNSANHLRNVRPGKHPGLDSLCCSSLAHSQGVSCHMEMNDIDLKALFIGLAVCFSIGAVIDYFTVLHWLPAGFFAMFAILFNGVFISIEDREPGGWDHVGNNNPKPDAQFKKMLRVQKLCAVVVLILGFVSYAYTSN